ncbi:hypothetical protein AAC387_Pa10g1731 [Persea americana]
MAFIISYPSRIPPPSVPHPTFSKYRTRVRVRSEVSENSELASRDRVKTVASDNGGISGGERKSHVQKPEGLLSERLGLLYGDGYGTHSVADYLDGAREMVRPDGGPPRWFSPVECGSPIEGSPVLLFLPGIDGVGLGLTLHHIALGRVFEVRCMHIPIYDRTPFEGLLKFVEETVRFEHSVSPNKPIYLVGDTFGGCLALAVAARNRTIDLMLVLSNPATSFDKSPLKTFLPLLDAMPVELHMTVPYLLNLIIGDLVKLGVASVEEELPPSLALDQLSRSLNSMLPYLLGLADIMPKETLVWKLKLLKSAASYANSRLHAVKAEVLILASGKDNLLPSMEEAKHLRNSLQNCRVRYFRDNGHTLLLEDGVRLLTVIKGTSMYRRSRKYDYVLDYLPPTRTEFEEFFVKENGWFKRVISPVLLSTLRDGKIVRGLAGVPNEGPVLLVGYHMLLGAELAPLVEEFIREKNILLRGIGHPGVFSEKIETSLREMAKLDSLVVFGATPVSASNFFRLFSSKSFILLYPGGSREALHRKGEEYKLFWPDQPEFVRMAARFGATIVPFGAVGEDDLADVFLDYNDQMRIPFVRDWINNINGSVGRLRTDLAGEEVADQDLYFPFFMPKVPGRFYYLFGKPIETKERMEMLKNRQNANEVYLQIKSEVEGIISYLLKKREDDPFRSIIRRSIYKATWGSKLQVPTFEH